MIAHRSVRNAIADVTKHLRDAGITDPARDARLLIAKAISVDPSRLTLHLNDSVSLDHQDAFEPLFERRLHREPMSHILGRRWFWGHEFKVTSHVLDPRPETETLVEAALGEKFSEVLDIGTGTGCILLTLLRERKGTTGIGIDVSPQAIKIAEENAELVGVANRCGFLVSDWWRYVSGKFDLIVSNPPYIAALEMAALGPELAYEPRIALTDEADGLSAYRAITAGAGNHLTSGGRLMVEIGWTQGAAVSDMFRAAGFDGVEIRPDLDGRDRVVSGIWRI